ncbi:MAG: aminopeptidase P family protein [Boseongicola sp. SB0676_bin_33]|nr:aminopeptidase P family protein [Boseongicola sp. SB0676_bin_33]
MTGGAFQEIEATTAGGRAVSLRFPPREHAARLAATRAELNCRGIDALLVFSQESHYYLAGYDSSGHVFFQAGVITADERPTILLTRRPDLRQAETASLYDDIRIWFNAEEVNPAEDLRAILQELGLRGARVGVELATYGLTAANGRLVEAALDGFCSLEDASDIVRRQRLVKSEAELAMMREAGRLADAAVLATVDAAGPGATER